VIGLLPAFDDFGVVNAYLWLAFFVPWRCQNGGQLGFGVSEWASGIADVCFGASGGKKAN
jgi:hypothetical protein